MQKEQTIFITKWILTNGIIKTKAFIDDEENAKVDGYMICFTKKEYCLSAEEAMEQAETVRKERILSLEKQIEKLKKKKFRIKNE